MDPTAVPRCMRLYPGILVCPACGFGVVEDRVLTVVLNPLNADRSEYYTQVRTTDGGETLRLTRPEGEQVFSVLVGAHVLDGAVSVQ